MSTTMQTAGGPTLAVRFTRGWQNYMAGDVATFPEAMARQLVDAGRAQRVNIARGEPPPGAELVFRTTAKVNK